MEDMKSSNNWYTDMPLENVSIVVWYKQQMPVNVHRENNYYIIHPPLNQLLGPIPLDEIKYWIPIPCYEEL
jgi:hypothetical protein